MLEWGFPGEIRPKKECIKSYETNFGNTLSLNDKHEMSLFPKVLWPFSYLILSQNKPSEFFVCNLLFHHYCLTMTDELYVYALYSCAN